MASARDVTALSGGLTPAPKPSFPVIFISDTHLFKKTAQADLLLEFLSRVECAELHIVGDFIDGWKMTAKKHRQWPEMHARVLDIINEKASRHRVVYYPGNHDEDLRKPWAIKNDQHKRSFPFLGHKHVFKDKKSGLSSAIEICESGIYEDPTGKKFLVLHGDQYDPRYLKTDSGKRLSQIGDLFYDGMIRINSYTIEIGKKFLKSHFSLAKFLKKHTKKAIGVIENFEKTVSDSVRESDLQGVITGHIHHAEIRDFEGITYMNAGDWVESATALTHDENGQWRIIHWGDLRHEIGFDQLPTATDHNPYEAYRGITKRQIRMAQRLWPANDRAQSLKTLFNIRARLSNPDLSVKKRRRLEDERRMLLDHLRPI